MAVMKKLVNKLLVPLMSSKKPMSKTEAAKLKRYYARMERKAPGTRRRVGVKKATRRRR